MATVKARLDTTFVGDRKDLRLGPHRAVRATIELAQTELLRSDPHSRAAKIGLVVTKFHYLEPVEPSAVVATDAKPTVNEDGKLWRKRTAVLLVGYYNDVEHFDRDL